jgi:replication fork clamp-binding protein CrfC
MHLGLKQFARAVTACVLVTIFAIPHSLFAEAAEHVVSSAELNKAVVDASRARQQNLDTLRAFFSSEKAQQALKSIHANPEQVKNAVASLSDAELSRLASRVQTAQADFAAGKLSDRDLIILLIAIAALILIIVAVR